MRSTGHFGCLVILHVFSHHTVFAGEYFMEMANTNCKDLREVFRSWTHSKSMLGVCILHDLLLFFSGES